MTFADDTDDNDEYLMGSEHPHKEVFKSFSTYLPLTLRLWMLWTIMRTIKLQQKGR
jgi:hypothetical protein